MALLTLLVVAAAGIMSHHKPVVEAIDIAPIGSDGAAEDAMSKQIHKARIPHSLRLLNTYHKVGKAEPEPESAPTHVNHVPGPDDTAWHAEMAKHGENGIKYTDEDYVHDKQPSAAAVVAVLALLALQ